MLVYLHKATHKVISLLNLHFYITPFHHYLTDTKKCHQQKKNIFAVVDMSFTYMRHRLIREARGLNPGELRTLSDICSI